MPYKIIKVFTSTNAGKSTSEMSLGEYFLWEVRDTWGTSLNSGYDIKGSNCALSFFFRRWQTLGKGQIGNIWTCKTYSLLSTLSSWHMYCEVAK